MPVPPSLSLVDRVYRRMFRHRSASDFAEIVPLVPSHVRLLTDLVSDLLSMCDVSARLASLKSMHHRVRAGLRDAVHDVVVCDFVFLVFSAFSHCTASAAAPPPPPPPPPASFVSESVRLAGSVPAGWFGLCVVSPGCVACRSALHPLLPPGSSSELLDLWCEMLSSSVWSRPSLLGFAIRYASLLGLPPPVWDADLQSTFPKHRTNAAVRFTFAASLAWRQRFRSAHGRFQLAKRAAAASVAVGSAASVAVGSAASVAVGSAASVAVGSAASVAVGSAASVACDLPA
jgi:hypothetical protein